MYRPAGPREMWTENWLANPGSFSTTQNQSSDDFNLQSGHFALSPARVQAGQTVAHDTTAYATIPPEDGWIQKFYGMGVSPAKVTASATLGTNTRGATT